MATTITPECINCAACVRECPNQAIRPGDEYFLIDPELCSECVPFFEQPACQAVCPVECCVPDPDRVETEETLLQRALRIHSDDAELKARVDDGEIRSRYRR
jgi:ferredoxin